MARLSILLAALALALACGEPQALQTVEYKQLASFQVPQVWQLDGEVDGEIGYVHQQLPGVELWVRGGVEDLGTAVTIEHLRSMLGREVNLKYGGAISRLSMGGNAVIRYPTYAEEEGQTDAIRWIVAKPFVHGMLRLDVSIEYLPDELDAGDLDALLEAFDPGVSDARFSS